jgi:uncharacterized circularly permuted ATP-grasp superfamily protein/uncharacterized alpha-E superfamily protein
MLPATPTTAPTELDRLLAGYARGAAPYDEMLAADGAVRPHWRRFVEGFAGLGPEGRWAAADSTRRSLRESGIAFDVHADPEDRRHAWRLDLVPVLLPAGDWERIAAGIAQRARLIDAVLADLYSEQGLLRDGSLPAALVLGSPAFVRPSVERGGNRRQFLHTYACDLARTADGSWVVLGDQTDTAIGNGYVLASRVALSHGLAELFRDCHAKRLAGYYLDLQAGFQSLCRREDGRIVVLSPGPESPSYFSHAYLARYLGYTVVQGADLTVRDDELYLKTLDGLQRVYVCVCKQPGHLLDPLHLPGSGPGGIPGLVHAARSGAVTVVNRLGSGVARAHALAPFAGPLFRRVLGEEPLLAGPPALWLGDRRQRERVLRRPEEWSIVEATARNDPGEPSSPSDPGPLDERLAWEGHRWVAMPPVPLATTPSHDGDKLVPTPFALRAYAVLGDDGEYRVLPGGLVRLAGAPTAAALPNGFGSKDLWVTSAGPERQPPSLLRAAMQEVHLRRTGRDLLSRTADNLFWLGRYGERAEGTMRLLRGALSRLLEDGRPDTDPQVLHRLLRLLVRGGDARPPAPGEQGWAAVEELAGVLMFGPQDYGLRDSLGRLQRNATLARDQISHDAWRMLNALHLDRRWRQPPSRALASWPTLELLDDGIRALNAFAGTEAENMTRNYAWRFLQIGRRIERAWHLARLTRELVPGGPSPDDAGSLRLLLELGDSFMTYRSRYMTTPLAAPVLDLLLLDETNPRGMAFQLRELEAHVALLPTEGPHRNQWQRLVLKLLTAVRLAEVGELSEPGADGRMDRLARFLDEIAAGLPQLSDLIARIYFAHAAAPVVTLATRRLEEP